MLNFSKTKVALIYLTFFVISFFSLSNFFEFSNIYNKKINLGLDLQGGSYLLLEVDSTPLEKRKLQSKVVPLKKKLLQEKINYTQFSISNNSILFNINRLYR